MPPKHNSHKKLLIAGDEISTHSPSLKTHHSNEAKRDKALDMIFAFFARKGVISHLKKATFDQMKM